jgi:hypothetical protein
VQVALAGDQIQIMTVVQVVVAVAIQQQLCQ